MPQIEIPCTRRRQRPVDFDVPQRQQRLSLVHVELAESNAFVKELHRHHDPVLNHRFSLGCKDESGVLRGVAIVGRPVARRLDYKTILEVNRVCTDGCQNACSFLYGACARAGKALGYIRIITYILASESGTSLIAAGWQLELEYTPGNSWSVPTRARIDKKAPLVPKKRYGKVLGGAL